MNVTEAQKQWKNFQLHTDSQFDNFASIDSPISSYPMGTTNNDPEYLACLAVSSLLQNGQLSSSPNSQSQFNPDDVQHRKMLHLANLYFKSEDVKNLPSIDKATSLKINSEVNNITNHRKLKISHVPENVKPFTDLAALALASSKNPTLIGAGVALASYDPLVTIGQNIGIIAKDRPLSLEEVKKYCNGMEKSSILSLLRDERLTFTNEARHFLNEECHFDHKDPIQINNIKADTTGITNTTTPTSTTPNSNAKPVETPLQQHNNNAVVSDPILQNMVKLEKSVLNLAEEYAAKQSSIDHQAILHDAEHLKVQDDKVHKAANDIENNLKNNLEFLKNAFICASKIGEAIAQDMLATRFEKQANFQMKQIINSREQSAEDRKKQAPIPHFSPSEMDLFALHVCSPNGLLKETIYDYQEYAKQYREALANLKAHLKERQANVKDVQELSTAMDATDKIYIDLMNKAREARAKTANTLRKFATALRIASAVLAFVPGVNAACFAASTTLETISAGLQLVSAVADIGQANASGRADRYTRRIHERVKSSQYLQQKLGNINSKNHNEIINLEAQLYQAQMQLLTGQHQLTNKALRKELQDAIISNSTNIEELKKTESTLQIEYENALVKLNTAKSKVDLFANSISIHKSSCKCVNCRMARSFGKNEKEKADNEYQTADANCIDAKKKFDAASNARKELEKLKSLTEDTLGKEKTVKFIKDQIEVINFKERHAFDFDRTEDKKLSDIGLSQQAMRISFAEYNEARRPERELAMHSFQVLRGLGGELSALSNSNSPNLICDLLGQFYHAHDRYKHFQDNAIPQYEAFKKCIQNKNIDFSSAMVHGSELVAGYLLPGVQLVTAGLTIFRLSTMLMGLQEQQQSNPEIEWMAKFIEKSFNEQRYHFQQNFNELTQLIDNRFEDLNQQIKILHNFINDAKSEIITTVKESSEKSNRIAYQNQWTEFRKSILSKRLELRTTYNLLRLELEGKNHLKQKEKIITFVNGLLVNYPCDKTMNGKSIALVEDFSKVNNGEKKISGLLPYISLHPKFFTGIFTSQITDNDKAKNHSEPPNAVLYLEVCTQFDNLNSWVNKNNLLKTDKEISDKLIHLKTMLNNQKTHLNNLIDQIDIFEEEAITAQNKCILLAWNNLRKQKSSSQKVIQEIVKKQIESYEPVLDLIQTQAVGNEKYFLLELINTTPLHFNRDALKLNELHSMMLSQRRGAVIMSLGITTASVVLFPLTSAIIGGSLLVLGCISKLRDDILFTPTSEKPSVADTQIIKPTVDASEIQISENLFYDCCEVHIIDQMQAPLSKFTETALYTHDAALQQFSRHVDCLPLIKYRYEFSNKHKNYNSLGYSYSGENSTLYLVSDDTKDKEIRIFADKSKKYPNPPIAPFFNDSHNANSLLDFSVTYSLQNHTYSTEFASSSCIQMKDLEQISKMNPITEEIKGNEKCLMREYFEWLTCGEKTQINNTFIEIEKEGILTPSHEGKFLPLIFPKKLMQEIESILFPEISEFLAIHQVLMIPIFDFQLDNSKENYSLSLHYKLIQGKESIDFCSFNLASFDKTTIDCFNKLSYVESEEKQYVEIYRPVKYGGSYYKESSEKLYDYKIGTPNIQEFLLQAMYAGNFQVPLPGKGTIKLQNLDLYVPNPQEFDGLFNLWKSEPVTINYKSQNNIGKTDFFGSALYPVYSVSYLSKRASLVKNHTFEDIFKEAFANYEVSYHLLKGIHKLRSSLENPKMSKDQKQELDNEQNQYLAKLGLISPTNKQEALMNFYLYGAFQKPEPKLV